MINLTVLALYCLAVYGFTNMVVHSNGPLNVFRAVRSIPFGIGDLFKCVMCFSTWVGLALSLYDMYSPDLVLTPFNMLLGGEKHVPLMLFLDAVFASGVTWIIHHIEDMIERINYMG